MKNLFETVVLAVPLLAVAPAMADDIVVNPGGPTWQPTVSAIAIKVPGDPTWKSVDAVHAPGDPTWRSADGRAAGYDADDPEECDEDVDENCARIIDPTY